MSCMACCHQQYSASRVLAWPCAWRWIHKAKCVPGRHQSGKGMCCFACVSAVHIDVCQGLSLTVIISSCCWFCKSHGSWCALVCYNVVKYCVTDIAALHGSSLLCSWLPTINIQAALQQQVVKEICHKGASCLARMQRIRGFTIMRYINWHWHWHRSFTHIHQVAPMCTPSNTWFLGLGPMWVCLPSRKRHLDRFTCLPLSPTHTDAGHATL